MNDIVAQAQLWLVSFAVTMPRIIAIFSLLPFFSDKSMPVMIRVWVSLILSSVVVPAVAMELGTVHLEFLDYFIIVLKEIFIGILIGYLTAIIFWVLPSMGFFIDTQRGTMNSDLFNPSAGGSTTPLGSFLSQVGTTLFFTTGGVLLFMEGVYKSYVSWPVLSYFPAINRAATDFFLSQIDLLIYLVLLLAAPVILIMFIAEFSMALIGRFVPQINIFILAMPIKSALGFFMLALYITFILQHFKVELFHFSDVFSSLGNIMK